jgi:DNA-binding transcriptional MocR family regulator
MAIDSASPLVAASRPIGDPQEFVASLLNTSDDRTAKGIAASVHRLITAGILRPGDRLPTVREISARLGVSPATVSESWQSLALVGALTTRGRAGTFVALVTPGTGPTRYMGLGGPQSAVGLDLSQGTPDPFHRLAQHTLPMHFPADRTGATLNQPEHYWRPRVMPLLT